MAYQISTHSTLKAMLHEAMFLATCNATMTTEKQRRLQRGCHPFVMFFFSQLATRPLKTVENSFSTSLKSPASKRRALIGSFYNKIALQVAIDMSHAATFVAIQVAGKISPCNMAFPVKRCVVF